MTDINNCAINANITVTQPAALNANFSGLNPNLCNSSGLVNLIPMQTGGVFSGLGINGNTFNPAIAGNGTHVITYTIGSSPTCSATQTFSVTVSGPIANFFCRSDDY